MVKKTKSKIKSTKEATGKDLPPKKRKKKVLSRKKRAKKTVVGLQDITWSGAAPLQNALVANVELVSPRYACTKAPHGHCIQFEYNSHSGQYDLDPQPIECGHCTHFIEPTG